MNIRKLFKSNAFIYVSVALLAFFVFMTFFMFSKSNYYKRQADNSYNRAFYELADNLEDIDSKIEKLMVVRSPAMVSEIASDIYADSAAAKACLSQLPIDEGSLNTASKFLTQAGDYCAFISSKVIEKGEITEEEFSNLLALSNHADIMTEMVSDFSSKLSKGIFSFERQREDDDSKVYANDEITDFYSGIDEIEKRFVDYPTLIYDGPFSEHIEREEPKMLESTEDMTKEEALVISQMYLGGIRGENLTFAGEKAKPVAGYLFSSENSGSVSIYVTKKGGMPIWFLDGRNVGQSNISILEAKAKAGKFLRQMGYANMTESYYEQNNNTVTFNFAFMQAGVIVYPDLIKVKVALDNGEIIGFESYGYIMSHSAREMPKKLISQKEAQTKISPHLSPKSTRLCIIPKNNHEEIFCYEFCGEFNDRTFLVYINAQTGKEEKILLLVENENGVLTI